MLQGLKALAADHSTSVIVLISKPPSPEVAERVLEVAGGAGKPVVVNFLGADPDRVSGVRIYYAAWTLEDAAAAAVALADGRSPEEGRPRAPVFCHPPKLAPGSNTFAVFTVAARFVTRPRSS